MSGGAKGRKSPHADAAQRRACAVPLYAAGVHVSEIAAEAGVHRRTVEKWIATDGRFAAARAEYVARQVEATREATDDAASSPLIADRNERLAFYTSVLRGEITETRFGKDGAPYEAATSARDRLKAAELLGKVHGDFEAHNEQKAGGPSVVVAVRSLDEARELARGKGE